MNEVHLDLTAVINCVKGVSKRLLAHRTEITLAPLARFPVFVGFIIITEYTGRH